MRAIVALLAGGLALGPVAAPAQDRPGLPRIAVLDWESPDANRLEPFREALRGLGHVEGRTILVEYRHAEGRTERAEALAAEIARRAVDVIVAFATPAALAAKRATSTIPIVAASADPVGTGLVSNLARPDGNVTGFSNMMPDLESKRIELLREILPGLKSVAFLGSTRDPAAANFTREAAAAAERIGARFKAALIADAEEIDAALAGLAREGIEAVIAQPLFTLNPAASSRLAEIAARHRLPVIAQYAHFPRRGGLLSYGPVFGLSQRVAAQYVDRILKGAKPSDLPVQQPTTFELAINLKTAKALGLTIPESLLARADEVIE